MGKNRCSKEIWRPIKGYVGMYEVSSFGNVRSLDREVRRCRQGSVYSSVVRGKDLICSIVSTGYPSVQLSKNGKAKTHAVHRLVAEAFIPNPNNLPVVMHLDDNKENNRKENLEWGTVQDNMDDMVSKGRQGKLRGSAAGNSKLTERKVVKIKELLKKGFSRKMIAEKFDVSYVTISDIYIGKTWSHVI